MDEEGEFKRRIGILKIQTRDMGFSEVTNLEISAIQHMIELAVDEARKEFEAIPDKAEERASKTGHLSHHYGMDLKEVNLRLTLNYFAHYKRLINEWVLKWFGPKPSADSVADSTVPA